MTKGLSVTLALFLMSIILFGQTHQPTTLTGIITDSSTMLPVEYASVALYKAADTTLVSGSITDSLGRFSLKVSKDEEYILKVGFVGYKTRIVSLPRSSQTSQKLYPIALQPGSMMLKEVEITSKQNERRTGFEKTTVNVSGNPNAASGNASDIIKNLSAVNIGADNQVYLRGNRNILLMIDGRPTTMESLNAIPSGGISTIEVITNPDVRYDAEGTGGIINIIMKKEARAGFSGYAAVNAGYENRINGAIGAAMNSNRWDISLAYSGRFEKDKISGELERRLYFRPLVIDQEIASAQTSTSNAVDLSVDFKPDKTNRISLNARLILPAISNIQEIRNTQYEDTLPGVTFLRRNEFFYSRKTFESTLEYKKTFHQDKQSISAGIAYSQTKGSRPADYYINDQYIQKSDGGGAPTNASVQIDFQGKIKNAGKIETGLKVFSRWNAFNYHFYNFDSVDSQWLIDSAFTNDLEYREFIGSGYFMYSDTLATKFHYRAGVRLEINNADFCQFTTGEHSYHEYIFPFPYLLIKYSLNRQNTFSMGFNRRVTRPTFPQLNPYVNIIDHFTYETGNKDLKPEVADRFEFFHSLSGEKIQLRSSLYLNSTKDFITHVSTVSDSGLLVITYMNGTRQTIAGTSIEATWKCTGWLGLYPDINLFFNTSTGTVNGLTLVSEAWSFTGNIKALFNPDRKTDIQLLLNYTAPNELLQFNVDASWYADLSVKRSFFENRLSVSLMITDIFDTRTWNIESDNPLYYLRNFSKSQTRILWLGLNYTLNYNKIKKQPKTASPEEDKGLIRTGG
jgi:hypothetical protein